MADRNAPVGANLSRFLRQMFSAPEMDVTEPTGQPVAGQRRQEDRAAMAAEAASKFDEEERRFEGRRAFLENQRQYREDRAAADRAARQAWRQGQSAITNQPVGAPRRITPETRMSDARGQPSVRQPMAATASPAEREAERATMMEANQPPARSAGRASASARRASAPAPRGMSEADQLNAISQAFIRGERPRGGAADTIGKAMGIEGYKKGGMIKPKAPVKKAAGGMIGMKKGKAPMAPGRGPGRPATAVKPVGTRAMAKAAAPKKPVGMPAFKKGGKVAMKKGMK